MWDFGLSLKTLTGRENVHRIPLELMSAALAISVPLICSTRIPQLLDQDFSWISFVDSEVHLAANLVLDNGKKVYDYASKKIVNIIHRCESRTPRVAGRLLAICDGSVLVPHRISGSDLKVRASSSTNTLSKVTGYAVEKTRRLLCSLNDFAGRGEKKTLYMIFETNSSLIPAFLDPRTILELALTNQNIREKLVNDDSKWIMPSIEVSWSNCENITKNISFKSLENLRIWTRRGFDAIHPKLLEHTCAKLVDLSLRGCAFCETDLEDLRVIRNTLPNLQSFNYEKNSLEDGHFMKLLEVIPVNVKKLCLRYNRLRMGPDIVDLGSLFTLEVLNLKNNLIQSDGLTPLVSLMALRRLLKLNLANQTPKLTDEAAAILSSALKHSELERLLLAGNSITDEGAVLFAEVLPECMRLIEVDLRSNLITADGTAQQFIKKQAQQAKRNIISF